MSPLGESALAYAARGWPVVPLHQIRDGACTCRHRHECQSPAKHPRTPGGLSVASANSEIVASWWAKWPDANIGLTTGGAFDVLDLDGPDALDALDAAAPAEAGVLITPMVLTGRGAHLWFAATGTTNRARMLPGVDWRGRGGYVIAPPSVHASGVAYEWGEQLGPDTPLVEPPEWLRRIVTRAVATAPMAPSWRPSATSLSRYGQAALDGELGRLMQAREGGRNHALNAAAYALGQLVAGGHLDQAHVVEELVLAGQRVGLGPTEVERTVASGLKAGALKPRQVAS